MISGGGGRIAWFRPCFTVHNAKKEDIVCNVLGRQIIFR